MYYGDDLGKEIHDLSTIIDIGVSQQNDRNMKEEGARFEKDYGVSHILHTPIYSQCL